MDHHEGLRETYAGAWQGLTNTEIRARFPEQFDAWAQGEPVRRGGGELATEVADRAVPVVLAAVEKLPEDGTLVVVSHGGTIRTMLGRLLDLDPVHWERFGGLSNCCWSVLGQGRGAGGSWNTTRAPSPSRSSGTRPDGEPRAISQFRL